MSPQKVVRWLALAVSAVLTAIVGFGIGGWDEVAIPTTPAPAGFKVVGDWAHAKALPDGTVPLFDGAECVEGNGLAAKYRYEEALRSYAEALDGGSSCAERNLRELGALDWDRRPADAQADIPEAPTVATTPVPTGTFPVAGPTCARGNALLAAGREDDALKFYLKAVRTPDDCAASNIVGLKAVQAKRAASAADPEAKADREAITEARRLLNAGYASDAEAKLKERVEKSSEFAVPAALQRQLRDALATDSAKPYPAVQRAIDATGPTVVTVGVFLVLWFALAALFELLRRLVVAWRKPATRPLSLSFEGALGADTIESLSSTLTGYLDALRKEGGEAGFRVIRPVENSDFTIPKALADLAAPTGVFVEILNAIKALIPKPPTRDVVIELLPPHRINGLGIIVSIDGTPSERIRERYYGLLDEPALSGAHADSRYAELMLIAAVWIAFEVDPKSSPKHFGTSSWKSFAYASVGASAHVRGNASTAELQYRLALDASADNQAARFNLASLLLQPRVANEDAARTHERLDAVRDLLEPLGVADRWSTVEELGFRLLAEAAEPTEPPTPERARRAGLDAIYAAPMDAVRARGQVLAAIARLYEADLTNPADPDRLSDSRLALEIVEHELGPVDVPLPDEHPLRSVAASIRATAALVHATLDLMEGKVDTEPPAHLIEADWLHSSVAYNVACFYARRSVAARRAGRPKQAGDDLAAAVRYLERALGTGNAVLQFTAATDPSLAPLRNDATAALKPARDRGAALIAGPPSSSAPPAKHHVTLATAAAKPVELVFTAPPAPQA